MINSRRLRKMRSISYTFLFGWAAPLVLLLFMANLSTAQKCDATANPCINPLKAGDKKVTGNLKLAAGSVPAATATSVQVQHPAVPPAPAPPPVQVGSPAWKADGAFTVDLDDALVDGDKVTITQTPGGASSASVLPSTCDKSAPKPPCIDQPHDGDPAITGQFPPNTQVVVTINDTSSPITTTKAGTDGKFRLDLASRLNPFNKISVPGTEEVAVITNPGAPPPGACMSGGGASTTLAVPTLGPIDPGVLVSGNVPTPPTPPNGAQIVICVGGQPAETVTGTTSPTSSGAFYVQLKNPLKLGDEVFAQMTSPGAGGSPTSFGALSSTVTVGNSQASFDFGRVRVNLSAGAILSQDQGQFSKTSTYLDLNSDSTWFMGDHHTEKTAEAYTKGAQLNSFFDVRLTALPATTCPQSTSGSGDNTGQCASQSGDISNLSVSTPKAALVAGGIYVPIYTAWSSWTASDGHRQALYFAPIVKGGFQTLVQSAQSTNGASGGSTPPTTTTTPDGKTFFHFAEFGGRFGLYKFHDEYVRSVAPDQLLYVDIAGGSYENFPAVNSAGMIIGHPWRLSMEGRFNIPKIPVFIGFNSNTRPGHGSTSAPGDLRFLFGTSFDVGCLLQKLGVTNSGIAACDSGSTKSSTASTPTATK